MAKRIVIWGTGFVGKMVIPRCCGTRTSSSSGSG